MYFKKLKINGIEYDMETVIVGEEDPSDETEGNLGQLYYNSNTDTYFKCTYAESGTYSWAEFGTTFFDSVEADQDTGLLHFLKDGEDVVDPVYIGNIGGGGGSGGGSGNNAVLTLTNAGDWLAKTISIGSDCRLSINWSSIENDTETGPGVLTVRVNNVVKRTMDISQGTVTINVKDLLSTGTNKVRLSVSDVYENTKSINFTIKAVELRLNSSFSSAGEFAAGNAIVYTYTPYAAVSKTVHFLLDGTELESQIVTTSGRQQSYNLPAMQHGAHSLAVWFTAEIDGDDVPSNYLYYDLIVVGDSSAPIVSTSFRRTEAEQYETLVIPYRVYTPGTLTSPVELYVGNTKVNELNVDRTEQTWSLRLDNYGELALSIRSGTAVIVMNLTVAQSDIDTEPEADSLVLHLTSQGRSNNEEHPEVWADTDHNISCTLSDFNFISNGWVADKDGNTVLRVSGDARVTIPYKPFQRDFRSTGKTLEFEFATRDVLDYDAVLVSCMSGNRGFQLTSQRATLKSERSEISTQYKEDEHVRIAFVAEKRTESRLIYIYINGIMSGVVEYPDDDDFSQQTPVNITIGANTCTTDLYNIRIYDNNLTRFQIVNNWIADTQNITAMLARYEHNNVFDEYGNVVISKLPKDLPFMIITAEELPQYKGDKKTVSVEYTDPVTPARSFTATGCQANVQGTSSAPYARKNYDMQFKSGFVLPDQSTADNYELAPGIIPFNRFVLKADVASSESANNVELVKLFCDVDPYKRPEEMANTKVRKGIYGFPIVLFWRNPADGSEQFMGKYNFNLPKRAPGPYGYSGDMESWEFQNNTSNLMLFLTDYFSEAPQADPDTGDVKAAWRYDYEARFPSDEWVDYSKLQEFQSFIFSTYRAGATGNALSTPVTYPETRVVYDEVVDPQTGAVDYVERLVTEDVTYTTDTAEYRLSRFHHEFGKYAEVDSFIFYYLFTELFLMVDSRAKNLFIGFSGGPTTGLTHLDRKAVAEPYDMDTAIGTNNEGSLVFDYGLEDTDHLTGGADVFNGQNSVLWCNLRDAFGSEIAQMYKSLRSSGVLSYATVSARFTDHQAKWPEAIFNEDAQFKYLDPLVNPDPGKEPTAVYLPMLQGSKAEQRKWWLYNRFRYMDSKWNAGDALSDVIQLRGYAKADITVTPYADIYPTIKYGSVPVQARGKHGVPQTLACPLDNINDTEIYIYSASQLASVGDLSGLKVGFADFSKATKLQSIKVGSDETGYTNQNLTGLSIGTNPLLGSVDARNCAALVGTVDLSGAANIETVLLEGTAVTGVSLPNGGILKTLHLPDTVTNLTVRNQSGITDFQMEDYSSITTLRVENSPAIPVDDILAEMAANSRVRILGFTATMTTTEEVEAFYDFLDTMRGMDENGNNLDTAVVSGTITGLGSITGAWLAEMQARYPTITIQYEHISTQLKYYSYDGSTLINTETILDGGNGTYSGTPSRASTAQYSYTFVGWNKNKNATANDPNATKAVTADRSVYAAYTATTRKYTVYWKNSNGTTLETDQNVPYGTVPTYNGSTPVNPTSGGGPFRAWTPTPAAISGDTTYTATYVPVYTVSFYNGSTFITSTTVQEGGTAVYSGSTPVNSEDASLAFLGWASSAGQSTADANILKNITANKSVYAAFESGFEDAEITDDWATIISKIEAGTYKTAYKVGNYKPLDLGTEGTINMQIVAFDTDECVSGAKAPITMIGKELLVTSHNMNSDGTARGWEASGMRSYLKGTILPLIPSIVAAAIKTVKKYSSHNGNGAIVKDVVSSDDVWIPGNREILGDSSYETSGPVYSSVFKDSNTRTKYKVGSSSTSFWWLRSARNASNFRSIYTGGNGTDYNSLITGGIALGFCLGDPHKIEDSWTDIIAAANDGTYATKYKVGDFAPLDLGTEGVVNMQIVGMGVDELSDDSGFAGLSFISKEHLATWHNMNATSTTSEGWAASAMRTYLTGTIKPLIPSEVRSAIKTVKKYSSHYGNNTVVNDVVSHDDVWIPGNREILGGAIFETQGPVYSGVFKDSATRKKHKVGSSDADSWWLRSASNGANFSIVLSTGGSFTTDASYSYGVALGFCIGKAPVPTATTADGAYGVEWDYSQSATTLTRKGLAQSFSNPAPAESLAGTGTSPFDTIAPWKDMKRYCYVNGAWVDDTDPSFDETAYDTMVYIPTFYYTAYKDTANSKWLWAISPTKLSGYEKHPGSGRYIGRFHTSGDSTLVSSKSGVAPIKSITRASGRTYSHNKGSNWWQLDLATWSALQMLYLVEFADWNSQSVLLYGHDTGSLGTTGGTTGAAYHTIKKRQRYNMYRWVEDPFSPIYDWCDGFVASDRRAYVGLVNSAYGDTVSGLMDTGIDLPSSGYITGFGYSAKAPYAFIPDAASDGSSTTFVPDYVNSDTGVRLLNVGGASNTFEGYGFFRFSADLNANASYGSNSSRLIYIP